jgi:DNA replication protein DnaC
MIEQLQQRMAVLKLRGMQTCLKEMILAAEKGELSVQEILHELLEAELTDRDARALVSRTKRANIPQPWALDTFPFKEQPGVSKTQIMTLAKLDFMRGHENIVFIGEPGRGKSGLAVSLLRLAIQKGYRGRFYNAQKLLDDLYASLADRTTSQLLTTIASYDLLLIDELGFMDLKTEHSNIFFKLIDMRYQKKSTMITTNLDYPEWYTLFKNKGLVDALLDRFQHFCITVHIKGPSLRKLKTKK